jgi:hypothetical protein
MYNLFYGVRPAAVNTHKGLYETAIDTGMDQISIKTPTLNVVFTGVQ